jgi:hypothetical protein
VVRLAKEADPEGERTLGVLTKPDCIDSEEEQALWKAVVNGTKYKLKLGWYVVCNPNQKQLTSGISFKEARKHEQEYFQSERSVWRRI